MTRERLNQILERRGQFGSLPFAFPREFEMNGGAIDPLGITEDEDQAIRAQWSKMSGGSCYNDALLACCQEPMYTEYGVPIPVDSNGRPMRDTPERYTQIRV